jgi:hypothetical protein
MAVPEGLEGERLWAGASGVSLPLDASGLASSTARTAWGPGPAAVARDRRPGPGAANSAVHGSGRPGTRVLTENREEPKKWLLSKSGKDAVHRMILAQGL